jgi:hypothetical protein
VTVLKGKLGENDPKFYPDGKAKAFHGLTCIAWIDRKSNLFHHLCELQDTIRREFERAGLENFFAFLEPESFHMTVCDIEADPTPIRVKKLDDRIAQLWEAFDAWHGIPREVTARVQGLGLKQTITALVRFDGELESELEKILCLEGKIKEATNVNVRDFTGHISLAYFVQYPGSCINGIKKILLDCERYESEIFTFPQFDLAYFTDMNEFIPVMTIDLENRDVRPHGDNIHMLKTVSLFFRAVTLLHRDSPPAL